MPKLIPPFLSVVVLAGIWAAMYFGPEYLPCPIKGNISIKGERIYHVPGGKYYRRTSISLTKGERWFCSEEEAREAGWRRSLR